MAQPGGTLHAPPTAAGPTTFQQTLKTHGAAAAGWLLQATGATRLQGVAKFYSKPLRPPTGWAGASVEATGWLVPTLLRFGAFAEDEAWTLRALEQAAWLKSVQHADGSFPGGELKAGRTNAPAVWDTGIAIFALLSAAEQTNDESYVEAANRAGRWLERSINRATQIWTKYTDHLNATPAYYTVVTWALLKLWRRTQHETYRSVALEVLTRVAQAREESGGFRNFGPDLRNVAPSTTVAATYAGFAESAHLLHNAGKTFDAVALEGVARLRADFERRGVVAGGFDESWEATAWYTCPGGTAQMVSLWLRTHQETGDLAYLNAAFAALERLLESQETAPLDPECAGAVPGSSPVWGPYATMQYRAADTAHFLNAVLDGHEVLQRLLEDGPCASC